MKVANSLNGQTERILVMHRRRMRINHGNLVLPAVEGEDDFLARILQVVLQGAMRVVRDVHMIIAVGEAERVV